MVPFLSKPTCRIHILNIILQKNYNIIRIFPKKKIDFFNKTSIKYEFLYFFRLKVDI